jgi:hypothetical protein
MRRIISGLYRFLSNCCRRDDADFLSANASLNLILRALAEPEFLVVFEGCSGRAVHLDWGTGSEIRSL